jgi:hypothetical protein
MEKSMTDTTTPPHEAKSTRAGGHKVRQFVQQRLPFHNSGTNHRHPKGATLWGEYLTPELYVVYSYRYDWPLFACWKGVWFKNEDKISPTTTRHNVQAHPLIQCISLSREILRSHVIGRLAARNTLHPDIVALAVQQKLVDDPVLLAEFTKERLAV